MSVCVGVFVWAGVCISVSLGAFVCLVCFRASRWCAVPKYRRTLQIDQIFGLLRLLNNQSYVAKLFNTLVAK